MKYIIALIASAGIILFWAVLSVGVGWDRGGGIIGMLFMWAVIAGVWGVIMAMPKSTTGSNIEAGIRKTGQSIRTRIDSTLNIPAPPPPAMPLDLEREKRLFATAMEEIENGAVDKGTWAHAFAESMGNQDETKARYIKLRVTDLRRTTLPPIPTSALRSQLEIPRAEPGGSPYSSPAAGSESGDR